MEQQVEETHVQDDSPAEERRRMWENEALRGAYYRDPLAYSEHAPIHLSARTGGC
jgi:hypothetical protein